MLLEIASSVAMAGVFGYTILDKNGASEAQKIHIRHRSELAKRKRPQITDEESQEMFGRLAASRANTLNVTITIFGEYEDRVVSGVVTGLDPRLHLVKVECGADWQLVDFADVLRVDIEYGEA